MDESRLFPLLNEKEIKKLKEVRIAVFGLGGVGSYSVEALARTGIGFLYLIDGDVIEPSNINRQLFALNSTMGMPKTEVAKNRVKDINPLCNVKTICKMVKPDVEGKLSLHILDEIDAIIDATDDISLKVALASEAEKRKILIISSGGTGNRLDAFNFEITDIYKTKGCPLCRALRTRLKRLNIKNLPIIYSKSFPLFKSNVVSSVSWCPSVAGLMMAGYVVQKILNKQ